MGIHTTTRRNLSGNVVPIRTGFLPTALFATTLIVTAVADTTLIPLGATWKYLDNGSDQGTAWRAPSFDDSAWAQGPAELGYGDGDEATVVNGGPASNRFITTYFRTSFNVADPPPFHTLKIRLLRDDGVVVYLNGTEIRRGNLRNGTIDYKTLALDTVGEPEESKLYERLHESTPLVAGKNVLAVEVHQADPTSTDVSFNLELVGIDTYFVTRGPYLQMGTPTSIILRWRTNAPTDSRVQFGTNPAVPGSIVYDSTLTTEHEVELTGLTPNTKYYYSLGSTAQVMASGAEFSFVTAPPKGTVQPIRVWILGDSGTKDQGAAAVRDGYATFTGSRRTDVWLMLGDNAYNDGTDEDYQDAVFDMYPSFLRQCALWPAIGNHDTNEEPDPKLTIPYFQMFNLPTAAEAGGKSSGTEKYYSFDYGNVHFICLDSMTSPRSPPSGMLTWLQEDLADNNQPWIIAYWHHPAYTKGSHDSDKENPLIEMRQHVLPILEAAGVDLILAGHSHCYERTFLIDGHYGLSGTFANANLINGGNGRESSGGAYAKSLVGSILRGTVYITAGNGGHVTRWSDGTTEEIKSVQIPAMFYSTLRRGSVVLDIDGQRMDVKSLRKTGEVDDSFTILKSVPPAPPAPPAPQPEQ